MKIQEEEMCRIQENGKRIPVDEGGVGDVFQNSLAGGGLAFWRTRLRVDCGDLNLRKNCRAYFCGRIAEI